MLAFAGVPLLLDDPAGQVQQWIEQYRPLDEILAVPPCYRDGRNREQGHWAHAVGMPLPNWAVLPPRWQINTLWWPTGASRFAVGLFLASRTGVAALKSAVGDSGSGTLEIGDGTRTISPTMYLLPPRPIGSSATSNPLHLVVLVDRRYFWQFAKLPQMFLGPTSTWANVRSSIVSALGVSVTQPEPVGYPAPDWSEFVRWHENPALAMDAYALTVGQRFVATIGGKYQLQKHDTAATTHDSNQVVPTAGGGYASAGAIAPGKLTVVFPKRQGGIVHANGTCDTITRNAGQYELSNDAPGEAVVHTTFQADYSSRSSTPANHAAMTNLADAIARDFYGWHKRAYAGTLPGIAAAYELTGFDDYLWFFANVLAAKSQDAGDCGCEARDGAEPAALLTTAEEPAQYLCHTIVQSLPPNFGATENLTQDPATDRPRTFRPSSVHRAELTGDFVGGGFGTPATAPARLLYDSGGAYPPSGVLSTDSHSVSIFDTMNLRGDLKSGDRVWVAALPADTEMFELLGGKYDQFTWFELYQDLVLAGNAEAKRLTIDLVDTGELIQVFDPYTNPGMWRGHTGYRGLARKKTGKTDNKQNYNIVWMETLARWINFTLIEDMENGEADATLDDYHLQGKNPAGGYQGTVYDPQGLWPDAIATSKGIAHYNDRQHRYEITACQQASSSLGYWVGEGVEGWTTGGAFPTLAITTGTSKTGWLGAKAKTDGEDRVGIEYLDGVAAPSTDGNFLVNKTGTYRFALHGLLSVSINGSYPGFNQTLTTSTNSGHNHTVTLMNPRKVVNGPHVWFQLHRRPAGGAMAVYTDDIGEGRQHWMRFFVPEDDLVIKQDISTEWIVALTQGDRLALRCRIEALQPGFTLTLNDQARIYWHISRLSNQKNVWELIP